MYQGTATNGNDDLYKQDESLHRSISEESMRNPCIPGCVSESSLRRFFLYINLGKIPPNCFVTCILCVSVAKTIICQIG